MRSFLVVLTLIGFSVPAFSQTMTVGTISMIRTGWDSVIVKHAYLAIARRI